MKLENGQFVDQQTFAQNGKAMMKCTRFPQFFVALAVATTLSVAVAAAQDAQRHATGQADRTDWFHAARWGVFTHYLSDTVGPPNVTVDQWNTLVDGFDVEGLARQLKTCGAGYYCITLGQNSGFYCSPNAAYDKYVGIWPSKCSRRDLIADLYPALERQGIKLMVYLPAGAPDRDPVAMQKLQWKNGPHRNREFQIKWEGVIREWSNRWGAKVRGWWFDGCYYPDAMYRQPDPPGFSTLAAAARAGNPQAIVAFNPGVQVPVIRLTEHEDYTAGEINDAAAIVCPGRWVNGAQWHMLSFLGPQWFAGPKPRYTNRQAIDITRKILDKGGVVTWDVNIQANGLIPSAFYEQLSAIGKALR